MTTLVVAELYPWPAVDGYRQRLHHLIEGLTRTGPVDLVTLVRSGHPDPVEPPIPGVRNVLTVTSDGEAGIRGWLPTWTRASIPRSDAVALPRRLLSLDWSGVREQLPEWVADDVDLVWYSHVDAWWPTHDLLAGRGQIVDFDNLENLALRLRRRIPPRFPPGAATREKASVAGRWALSRGFDLVDERRWDAIQRTCAAQVDHVVVCSDLDAQRSGCANAVVVPNGSDPVPTAISDRRVLRGDRPTMLFVGALDYEPNTEAVEWLVREVVPVIVAHRPDAVIRIVGRGSDAVSWVADHRGVDLVGSVAELGPELAGADVSIVPIRVGAGTRLKVVEAMANHLPLVTTTVGCEGIDVVDGVSAMIEDDPRRFADACLRLIDDGPLRQRLADAGADLFAERYTWETIGTRVADLAMRTARSPEPG